MLDPPVQVYSRCRTNPSHIYSSRCEHTGAWLWCWGAEVFIYRHLLAGLTAGALQLPHSDNQAPQGFKYCNSCLICVSINIYTYMSVLLLPWEVICQSVSAFLLLLTQCSHISFALQWGGEVRRLVMTAQASLHAFGLNAQQIVFVWITCLAHYFRFPEHSNWAWAVAARCQTSDPTAERAEVCDDAHTLRRNFWWICLLQLLDERLLAAIHRDETYCVFLLLSCTFADIYCSSRLHFSP